MTESTVSNTVSLKGARKVTSKNGPEHFCDNCNCKRYSPCGCKRRKSRAPVHENDNAPVV